MLNKKAFRPVLIAAGCVVLALILCAVFLRDATMAVIDLDGDVAVIPGSAENPDYTKEEVAALLQKSLEGRFETVSCVYDEAHYVYTVYLTRAGMAVPAVQAADGTPLCRHRTPPGIHKRHRGQPKPLPHALAKAQHRTQH